jgi:glutamine amidotransferase
MVTEVTLIDYGLGNLFSVTRALEYCGVRVAVSSDPGVVRRSPRLLLPGVGAFGHGMSLLTEKGLDVAIKEAVVRGAYLLGVCLGMQFLLDTSEEFGLGRGLGLIPGKVVAIPKRTIDGRSMKIPHIGWNQLIPSAGRGHWDGSLLATTPVNTPMYFVHSFMACPETPGFCLADSLYGDTLVAAVIGGDNVWGAQFHPEKSGEAGLNVLRRFVEYA